jgi:hypothetical protein
LERGKQIIFLDKCGTELIVSTSLLAQDAKDLIPRNQSVKDTVNQKDLRDIYKKWFESRTGCVNPP